MKITLESVDGLPETLAGVVEEQDGAKVLDLSKVMPVEDLTGLKSALQKERANAQAYSKLGAPDEIAARIADLEQKAKGNGKGAEEAQAKLDALAKDFEAKLADKDKRLQSVMRGQAAAALKAELAKAGFIPDAIDDIAASALSRVELRDDGTMLVLSADGKPMTGTGPDYSATLADLAKDLAAAKAYAVADTGKGGSGKQPQGSGGKPGTVRASELDSMTPRQKAEFFAKNPGVTIAD